MQPVSNLIHAEDHVGPAPGSIFIANYKPRDDGSTMKALTWQGRENVKVKDVPSEYCDQ